MSGAWGGRVSAAVTTLLIATVPATVGAQEGQTLRHAPARTSQTVAVTTEQGMFEIPGILGSAGDSASPLVSEGASEPAAQATPGRLLTTLWSYDDEDAIADGVAIDDIEAWGAWHLTGSRLSTHAILGDGTPDFEFSSFGSGSSGVASAKGADRIVFIEGNDASDQYRVHGFTSQSGGTPDWTFELPPTMTGLLVNFRHVAVSYDGSIAAAIGRDTPAEESTLYVFDAETGEVTFTWTDSTFMGGVDLTDDGSLALVTQQSLATVIDTVTGEIVFQTPGSGAGSIHYRISGDGSVLVVGGFDLDVYKHDGTTYQPVIELTRPTSWFGQASVVSRDGSTVGALAHDYGAAYLECEAFLFDVATGELLGSQLFTGSGANQGVAADAASSDDGSVMAFASWGTEFHDWPEVMVFNRDVELIGAIEFPGSAFSVDVSADGEYVVGGSKAVHANTFGNGGRIELIEIDVGGGGPVADVTPGSFDFEVPHGGSDGDTLNIGNLGDEDLVWSVDEAETGFAREGAPYRYGLAGARELYAPVGYDRASGRVRLVPGRAADRQVLPAPQPAAVGSFTEGFDDITQLPGAGWAMINNSEPTGPSSWFQGNETIFPSHEGAPDAYIAANFESTDDSGDISNWLITPEVTIVNGTQITFWTRTSEQFEEFFDRLEVRMSVAGDSTDVGDTAESVGDFAELLLTINPDLGPGEYPEEWTQFTLTVRERSREPVTGRFAFRYWVTDSGPDGTNGDYIGIDTVSVTQPDGTPPGGCDSPVDIPWLAADPTSGTTAPGGSEPVDVSVDTAGLEVGEHAAQLCVTTNDPNAPLVAVPVTLTVVGDVPQPIADIAPDSFTFEVPVGGSDADVLSVGNIGTADLVWNIDETEGVAGAVRMATAFGDGGPRATAGAGVTTPPDWMLRYDPRLHQDPSGHRVQGVRPAFTALGPGPGAMLGAAADWSPLGPPGGDVFDVAASTVDPDIVFAGLAPSGGPGGTLYRSSDGGATWSEVPDLSGVSVYDIELTPAGDVYLGTIDSVWESNDGGQSWIALDLGIGANDQVFDVAVDPSDPAILWAGVADALGGQPVNIVRSTDGGATWSNRTPPLSSPMSGRGIAVDPGDSNTVIAVFGGNFGGGQVWVTTDSGTTWTNRSAGLPGNPMNDVVYDGTRLLVGGGLLFGSQPVGLYQSDDLGTTWTPLHDATWPLLMVEDIAVDPNDAQTIVVATDGSGVHRTTDGGASWEVGVGGTGSFAARALRFRPANSTELFLGASSLAVFRSTDGGDTFFESAQGISDIDLYSIDANPLAPDEVAIAFQGQNDGGIYTSLDGGATWGLEPVPGTRYSTVRFAPDGTLYALSTGPTTVAEEGLYRREADGSWTPLGPDQGTLFESELQSIHFSVNDPDLIVLGGGDFGVAGFEATIWLSTDGGQSWLKAFEGPVDSNGEVTDVELVEDGTDQQMIASHTSLATQEGGILRSVDGGVTWEPSSSGLPGGFFRDPDLCASSGDPQVFYLSAWPDFGHHNLFQTSDGGVTWASTGWTGDGLSQDLACDPTDPQVLYTSLTSGPVQVARSLDGGATFEPFTDGLEGVSGPRALAFAGPNRLLLASNKGAYATPLDGGGGGDCASPIDVSWLSFTPDAGTTPPGETDLVDVLVDATGLEQGEHTARLCMTTNDPNAPLVEVPVQLIVTGGALRGSDRERSAIVN